MSESIEVIHGSGNVWADLGYADADILQAKGVIAAKIIKSLDDQSLSTRKASARTGFAAADFSRVRNADLSRFTLDRLIRMLHSLDSELKVEVAIETRKESSPQFIHA